MNKSPYFENHICSTTRNMTFWSEGLHVGPRVYIYMLCVMEDTRHVWEHFVYSNWNSHVNVFSLGRFFVYLFVCTIWCMWYVFNTRQVQSHAGGTQISFGRLRKHPDQAMAWADAICHNHGRNNYARILFVVQLGDVDVPETKKKNAVLNSWMALLHLMILLPNLRFLIFGTLISARA